MILHNIQNLEDMRIGIEIVKNRRYVKDTILGAICDKDLDQRQSC